MANVIKCLIMVTLSTLTDNVLFIGLSKKKDGSNNKMYDLYIILYCNLATI